MAGTAENSEVAQELVEALGFSPESAVLGLEQGFRCAYCDRWLLESIDTLDLWENDHLTPVSRGGEEGTANLVLSCRLCNKIKRHWIPSTTVGISRRELTEAARVYVSEGRRAKQDYLDRLLLILERHGQLPNRARLD